MMQSARRDMTMQHLPDLAHWPADYSLDIVDQTICGLLRHAAETVPDRIALVNGVHDAASRRRWTYAEMAGISERLARALLGKFSPGDRVVVFGTNSPEWVFLQHAMSMAGILLVPVNPAYTTRELAYILRNSEAAGLFHDEEFRGKALADTVENALRECGRTLSLVEKVNSIWALAQTADPAVELPEIGPLDPLQVQYTSGTTGNPKGALLHHKGVLNTSRSIGRRAGFPDGGVHINAMPMFHIAGAAMAEFSCLAFRGTFVLMPHWDAGLMLELFEAERGTATLIVPTMILGILAHEDLKKRDLSSWKTIFTGAANVPASMVERVRAELGCDVAIIFGQTESNGPITLTSPDDALTDKTETVGRPLPQVEVRIVHPETLQTLPTDEIGEIWVRGFQTMSGYFQMPDKTAETLVEDGWLRTGDLGSMDARGYVKITGRLKEMIIRGGMHLYPKEMEDVLFDHPSVDQVAVIGLPDPKWGEEVAAVISLAPNCECPSVEQLRQYCAGRMSRQKVPKLWFAVENWPLTPSGKIQKHELVRLIEENQIELLDN